MRGREGAVGKRSLGRSSQLQGCRNPYRILEQADLLSSLTTKTLTRSADHIVTWCTHPVAQLGNRSLLGQAVVAKTRPVRKAESAKRIEGPIQHRLAKQRTVCTLTPPSPPLPPPPAGPLCAGLSGVPTLIDGLSRASQSRGLPAAPAWSSPRRAAFLPHLCVLHAAAASLLLPRRLTFASGYGRLVSTAFMCMHV